MRATQRMGRAERPVARAGLADSSCEVRAYGFVSQTLAAPRLPRMCAWPFMEDGLRRVLIDVA